MPNLSPIALFSPLIWYDASALVGADGSTVTALPDLSGNANNTAGSSGAPKLKLSAVNGLNAVYFDGGDNRLFTPVLPASFHTGNFTIVLVTRLLDPTPDALNVLLCEAAGNWYLHRKPQATAASPLEPYAICELDSRFSASTPWSDIAYGLRLHTHPADALAVHWFSFDGSNLRGRFNGMHNRVAATGSLGLAVDNAIHIGGYRDGTSFNFTGFLCEALIYNQALARWQLDAIELYAAAKWGISPRPVIVFDGNSQTYGYGLADYAAQAFPAQVEGLYPADAQPVCLNLAVPSQTTRDMIADAAEQVDWNISPLVPNPTLVATEMINDFASGQSMASVQANWVSYCQARRAAGWRRIVAPTIFPLSSARGGVSWETSFRQPMIAWLLANYRAWADALARVDLDPVIGPQAAADDTTLFADGIHLSATGCAVAAADIQAAIYAAGDAAIAPPSLLQNQIVAALSLQGFTPTRAANLDHLNTAPFAGPNAVTFAFCDAGGTPMPGVAFVVRGVGSAVTGSDGRKTVSLPTGAFTVAAVPTGGVLWPDTPITVLDASTFNILGTAIAIASPASPGQTTAFLTTRDGQGNPLGGVTLSFGLIDPQAPTDGFDQTAFTAVSGSVGLLQVTLLKNTKYQARVGGGAWITFTTGSSDTFALPEILGNFGT